MVVHPQFNIDIAKIPQLLGKLLAENRLALEALLESQPRTWNMLIPPLEVLEQQIKQFWSPVAHLHAVKSSVELRHAYQECLPLLTEYESYIGHNEKLYQAFLGLKNSAEFIDYNSAQKQLVEHALRDFRLSGVALSSADKKKHAALEEELSALSAKFSENVLNATQEFKYLVVNKDELRGVPTHIAELPELTLDYPCYSAIQTYAENRDLREKFYRAYVTRALNNTPIMEKILALRAELARLLGFANYAELSLASKMARKSEKVQAFLDDLIKKVRPIALHEFAELKTFAGIDLQPWDIAFYSEKLKQERYHIDEEALRVYFPLEQVLQGLFQLMQQTFGMYIKAVANVAVWHPDVQVFAIYDKNNKPRGYFYIDLYVRENKREGAWMDDFCSRRILASHDVQIPVAFLTCNFARPQKDQSALLTHEEVITLFHEFGHGIHHLLTQVDYVDVAGINGVPWDAVEFPSQFMENFCWQPQVLKLISHNLPDEIISNLLKSRYFHAGLHLIRQLEFASFDLQLHQEANPVCPDFIQSTLNKIRKEISVIAVPAFNRSQNTFSHIFDGEYAAGYYSYLWAEVISCDAFSFFEKEGVLNPTVGKRFLESILEMGGSASPFELFKRFAGREPNSDAFLKCLVNPT